MIKNLLKKCFPGIENNFFSRTLHEISLMNNYGQSLIHLLKYFEDEVFRGENDYRQVDDLVKELDKFIDRKSAFTMLDVGSRDAKIAILLKRYFPSAAVYAFECNPPALVECRQNIAKSGLKGITLIEKAVSDYQGKVDFYAVDPSRLANIGASSLYLASTTNPELTRNAQYKIAVEAITLKQWAVENRIEAIDLLWMDLQGGELKALIGLGELIHKVKFIYTEVEYQPLYEGQPLFEDVDRYLAGAGFRIQRKMYIRNRFYGNVLYSNNSL